MSDEEGKKKDRRSIEERRRLFMERAGRKATDAAFEGARKARMCLSIMPGKYMVESGRWEPDALSRGLARDPEAPADLLLLLAQHLSSEVLSNPSWSLYLLQDPMLLHKAHDTTLVALAKNPLSPAHLLEAAWRARPKLDALRRALAEHPATPAEIMRELALDRDPAIRQIALERSSGGQP